jgi:F0F1-type ATP synthase membrane subunit c/vacuolar-type H+-ATPase subunit K
MSESMSFEERRAADKAALDREIRREGRMLIFAAIGSAVGFLALVAAGPFIFALLRRLWAYYGVA